MAGVNPIGSDPSGISGIVQRLSTQLQQVEGLNQQQQGSVLQEDSQVANQLVTDLMQNQGQCVSRTMIMENVWKMHSDTITNVVDVYVNYLRKKIDEGLSPKLIHTVRGSGYELRLGVGEG